MRKRVTGRDCTGKRTHGHVFSCSAANLQGGRMFRATGWWDVSADVDGPGAPRRDDRDGETTLTQGAAPARPRVQVTLFDAQGEDSDVELRDVDPAALGKHQLLWVDVLGPADAQVAALLDRLGVPSEAQPYLLRATGKPCADDHGDTLHVEVAALVQREDGEPSPIVCLAGNGWVVTSHPDAVPFLEDFRERASGGSDLGTLDAPSFLARVLEWQLTTYNVAIEEIVERIDELDQGLLVSLQRHTDLLPQLVGLRRRIAQLRMQLAPHREVFARLASPELDHVSSAQSSEAFRALSRQVAEVIATIEDTREMLLGSFDILMSRTSQRTNDVMKVLTIASVVILPSTLIAGVLGMNFHPPFFDSPNLFWATLGLMALLICATLLAARRLRWI
jgi:magnesium transporter